MNEKAPIIIIIVLILVVTSIVLVVRNDPTETTPSGKGGAKEVLKDNGQELKDVITEDGGLMQEKNSTFTLEEISLHADKSDCWLLISGKVYNVASFINTHPGGDAILEGCGKDATALFETRPVGSGTPHSEGARVRLESFYIGDLK
jgi:cytochrome b involved in lipid metabolism